MVTLSTAPSVKAQSHMAKERHVLVIDDGNRRAIALDAAAYSIGRDSSNAIVLNSGTVSRKHAILLRLPIPGEQRYRYRLIDGDSEGKPSANGIFVNRKRCNSHELVNGDIISLGLKVQASYLTVSMEEAEFTKYLESIEFHRLKSDTLDAKATMVNTSQSGKRDDQQQSQSKPDRPTLIPDAAPTLSDGPPAGNWIATLSYHISHHPLRVLGLMSLSLGIPLALWWVLAGKTAETPDQSRWLPTLTASISALEAQT